MPRRELLRKIAEEVYGPEKARRFWKRIDIIGDIAIIKKPFDVELEELKPLAEALLARLPYVKSVWAASSPVEGMYRLRKFVHLAGEQRSLTIHREYGCSFLVDITKVYISPRLSYEHYRVAKLVKPGEVVINMYAGAGLFSIIIARHAKPQRVYSIDINPDAYQLMVHNVKMNKVEDIVVPILGDAAKVVPETLRGTANRILMPLPELALEHLPAALAGLREGRGVLHVYLHIFAEKGVDPRSRAVETLVNRLEELGVKKHRVLLARVVRTVGPRRSQVVVDVEVET
ncbi:class I SAM-dependent methyltransferase [Hyperthermus butylicus]|uniref:Methyltransferase n=1 Tax=Hyperthermus butylicus (strain DSM 5456 / JCM 9403 / PLM1-5) TaxID=415426 RepID=A2BJ02_HYPBU|nr:50S ribosomal protein L11 methyltransferase [Hyperthermus butylicus]ABM79963.1 methyltransferase [Hyperthermus butylicus DSM 5456]